MKAEEFLDPTKLPEELQWVPAHYRLHPDDPVYLLIAWHWHRVQGAENTLQAAMIELKTLLDARITTLADAADNIAGVSELLGQVQDELKKKPEIIGKELEKQLRQPVSAAVAQLEAAEQSLAPVTRSFRTLPRRQLLAAFLSGIALGLIGAVVLFQS